MRPLPQAWRSLRRLKKLWTAELVFIVIATLIIVASATFRALQTAFCPRAALVLLCPLYALVRVALDWANPSSSKVRNAFIFIALKFLIISTAKDLASCDVNFGRNADCVLLCGSSFHNRALSDLPLSLCTLLGSAFKARLLVFPGNTSGLPKGLAYQQASHSRLVQIISTSSR